MPSRTADQSPPPRFLVHGIDTLECGYYLMPAGKTGLDFADLARRQEAMRAEKNREGEALVLGGTEFLLRPFGTGSGYPFVLTNRAMTIQIGEFNWPSFFVRYSCEALWHRGLKALHDEFVAWAVSLGFVADKAESLSRVDFAFDYQVDPPDFEQDHFVTTLALDNRHRRDRVSQTFTFGRSPILFRAYDKVAEIAANKGSKSWFQKIWNETEGVWRMEWQVRKDALHRFALRSMGDLQDSSGDLLRHLAGDTVTLRTPTADSNRSRWPHHPLWRDLQARIDTLPCNGVIRSIDAKSAYEVRLSRLATSLYGQLKGVAALDALVRGQDEPPSLGDAITTLSKLTARRHDPITWRSTVSSRMSRGRLGTW